MFESVVASVVKFRPVSSLVPNVLRIILILFALALVYRVNDNHVKLWDSIGVIIFPTFYIAYIAVIAPRYLNLFVSHHDGQRRPRDGFFEEVRALSSHKTATLFIFLPLYALLTYQINKHIVHGLINRLV